MYDDLEQITGPVPGEHSLELATALARRESRNVTYLAEDFPVFWETASGANITDVDGNRYIDLSAAFGVAAVGHANPYVASSISDQASRLMHGMGDVHPTEVRTRLLDRLARIAPAPLEKSFLASTGAEAVEAAMKTAMLATGKPGFVTFRNAYHGLSLGTLLVSGLDKFRAPFSAVLRTERVTALEFPNGSREHAETTLMLARSLFESKRDIAALIVEPIQGRAGCIVPPPGFLSGLRKLCDEFGVLLIFDEIYTGFGRTGVWFACMHEDVVPDMMCIGKAMGSGFPISALLAKASIMDAWPVSEGEALHTSTYLGNPMGCAAALATIHELERLRLPQRAHSAGKALGPRLNALLDRPGVVAVRGRGLMWGIELNDGAKAVAVTKAALAKGVIILPSGPSGNVLSITPPLVISDRQLYRAIDLLESLL